MSAAAWVEVERLRARVAELEREREGCADHRGRVMDYLWPAWVDGYKTATAECLTRIAELERERDEALAKQADPDYSPAYKAAE